jgi:creatinine amidohydrolase/Fe(II)-dependent formamide hydrolase-like protein
MQNMTVKLVMALEPELVHLHEMELDPPPLLELQMAHHDNYQHAEKIVDDPLVVPRLTQRPEIRVGVMGHPERASRELGLALLEDMVANAADQIGELEARADGVYKEVSFVPEPMVLSG